MKNDPVSVVVLVLVASFVIDRMVSGLLFLLSFSKTWNRVIPDVSLMKPGVTRARAEKKQKLVYFVLAGFLGVVVLAGFGQVRLLASLRAMEKEAAAITPPPAAQPAAQPAAEASRKPGDPFRLSDRDLRWLDLIVTGLVLMGVADRLSQILKLPGAPGVEKPEPKPLEITGKLTIEDVAGKVSGTLGPAEH